MKKVVLILLSMSFMGLAACTSNDKTKTTGDESKATPAQTSTSQERGYTNITTEEAKKRLDSEKEIVLLDVRTQEEHDQKHIPKSVLIPVDVIEKEATAKLTDKDATIFVYCRSGNRSVTASNVLIDLGYTKIFNVEGGINSWRYDTESSGG